MQSPNLIEEGDERTECCVSILVQIILGGS